MSNACDCNRTREARDKCRLGGHAIFYVTSAAEQRATATVVGGAAPEYV